MFRHVAMRAMFVHAYNTNTNNAVIRGTIQSSPSLKCHKVTIPYCTLPYPIVEVYNALLASRYQLLPETGTISAFYFDTSIYGKSAEVF